MKKRVLISGNFGFIGGRLQPALKLLGYEVFGFDIAPPSQVDVNAFERVKEVVAHFFPKPDLVIHLAANVSSQYSLQNPQADFEANALSTLNMLEIARQYGAGFIYPSTQKVLENEQGARSPYGLSKYVGELLCREWRATFAVPTLINRFSNLYGPGGDKFWVNVFMKKALAGETIEVWGDGSATRDMLYIDDVISLLVDEVKHFEDYAKVDFVEAGGGKGNQLSVKQLLTWLDYDKVEYRPSFSGDKQTLLTDNYTVTGIRGWQPKVSLEEGLKLTKAYYV
jgi:UDP-glucuronate decarboxylase